MGRRSLVRPLVCSCRAPARAPGYLLVDAALLTLLSLPIRAPLWLVLRLAAVRCARIGSNRQGEDPRTSDVFKRGERTAPNGQGREQRVEPGLQGGCGPAGLLGFLGPHPWLFEVAWGPAAQACHGNGSAWVP